MSSSVCDTAANHTPRRSGQWGQGAASAAQGGRSRRDDSAAARETVNQRHTHKVGTCTQDARRKEGPPRAVDEGFAGGFNVFPFLKARIDLVVFPLFETSKKRRDSRLDLRTHTHGRGEMLRANGLNQRAAMRCVFLCLIRKHAESLALNFRMSLPK